MKTIGMLGGMSWESTATYYQLLNQGIKKRLGGLHSAKIYLHSVDFAEIESLQRQGEWSTMANMLTTEAQKMQQSGADFLVICTNTMHKVAPEIEEKLDIPVLHIADALANVLLADGVSRVGLLGTRFTMEQDFYKTRLSQKHGIEVVVPSENERNLVHEVIYEELCRGVIKESSRQAYVQIINSLSEQGAQAVILGCTEISLLVKPENTALPLYDTTAIHAEAAVSMALS
ncbi:aspartate/glutamate racemase family protein [Alteromonadaceae bacterium M269]|nr:aspartate/glutamate racemase family protein [Alteromonadaceae bacterium M269]